MVALGGLFLGASAAERLAVKLEEREQLAERVRELEAKRDKWRSRGVRGGTRVCDTLRAP